MKIRSAVSTVLRRQGLGVGAADSQQRRRVTTRKPVWRGQSRLSTPIPVRVRVVLFAPTICGEGTFESSPVRLSLRPDMNDPWTGYELGQKLQAARSCSGLDVRRRLDGFVY